MAKGRTKPLCFSEEDLRPKTGFPEPRSGGDVFGALAAANAAYNGIYVHNPMHNRVFGGLDELRLLGLATRGQGQMALRCIAPSGSGKTTTVVAYQRLMAKTLNLAESQIPVLIVPLEHGTTVRSLWTAVLRALGDTMIKRSDTEETLRARAYKALVHFGVQLLVLDEVQHLDYSSNARTDPTDTLKRILDDGIIPLVFLGTEESSGMLKRNVQLANRMLPPCDIHRLDPQDQRDRQDFEGFLLRLDKAIVDRKLTREASNLAETRTAACLLEVSSGVIGRVVNLVRVAFGMSFRREAARIELCDLSTATENWAVAQGLAPHNPFRFIKKAA
jgi:hypothetical protein